MKNSVPAPAPEQVAALSPSAFLALSSGLTGVSPAQLQPANVAVDFARLFYASVCRSVPVETLDCLSRTFLAADTITEGAAEVLIDPHLAPVGRNIIRLWLTGVWQDPRNPDSPPSLVGDQSYRQSSVWRVLQGHPMNDLFGSGR